MGQGYEGGLAALLGDQGLERPADLAASILETVAPGPAPVAAPPQHVPEAERVRHTAPVTAPDPAAPTAPTAPATPPPTPPTGMGTPTPTPATGGGPVNYAHPRRQAAAPAPEPEPRQGPPTPVAGDASGWSMDERLYNQVWGMFEDLARTAAAYRSACDFAESRLDRELDETLSDYRARADGANDAARAAARARHDELVKRAQEVLDRDLAQLVAESDVVEAGPARRLRPLGQPRLARLPRPGRGADGRPPRRPPPPREDRSADPHARPAAAGAGALGGQRPRPLRSHAASSTRPNCDGSPWTARSRTRPGCSRRTRRAGSPSMSSTRPVRAPPRSRRSSRRASSRPQPARGAAGVSAVLEQLTERVDLLQMAVRAGASDALPPGLDAARQLLLVHDFPHGFDDRAVTRLRYLADEGPSVGVHLLMVADREDASAYGPLLDPLWRSLLRLTPVPDDHLADPWVGHAWSYEPPMLPPGSGVLRQVLGQVAAARHGKRP